MTAQYRPSFQKIISDEIHSSCPSLKESDDSYLNEPNIYLRTDIFGIIFEILNEKRTLGSFDVERNQLLYNNKTMVLAQGEEAEMHILADNVRNTD